MAIYGNSTGTLTQASLLHPENLREIRQGLIGWPRRISSRYFYDDRGSELFREITELDEYYLTGCEFEILNSNARRIADHVLGRTEAGKAAGPTDARTISILEAGPGDGSKAQIIAREFASLSDSVSYGAIDISPEALSIALLKISEDPGLPTYSVVGDTLHSLRDLTNQSTGRRLFLFLGSNIGNYTYDGAVQLLTVIRRALEPGDFILIGFDLEKPAEVLIPAYSDSRGVTREFNLNLLRRMNRELGANFDISAFEHEAHYNAEAGAMQSFLVSQCQQRVTIEAMNLDLLFEQEEAIHTENSHKFTLHGIERMAAESGFAPVEHLSDLRKYFATSLWQVPVG
ncbi:MAG: L-histidine N(alpha)-methyltransferase [Leptospirales bacterium]|nr:L-histidine N(alpha)-methyltransferase [Leptospirales bacterium]